MKATDLLRAQLGMAHNVLEGTMADVTADQLHWTPPGLAHQIGALYAHIITGEDGLLHQMVLGSAPLMAGEWAGKLGLSEPPPPPGEAGWADWARRVRVDLDAARAYAQAVYAATDAYLASISDADLDRPMDLSGFGVGEQTVGWFLGSIVIGHVNNHCGEVSALKGVQGARGYPF